MSFTTNICLIVIKILLLWLIAVYINHQSQRDSASWQHRSLVIFLIVSPLLVLSPWMAFLNIPIKVPLDQFSVFLALDNYQLPLLLVNAFVCSFLIANRLIALVELAWAERQFTNAPAAFQALAQQFLPAHKSCHCMVAPSNRIFAYVWRPFVFGKHRLVISKSVLQLKPQQQKIIIAHECALHALHRRFHGSS